MSHQDRVFFGNFVGVLAFLVVLAFVFFYIAKIVGGPDPETVQLSSVQVKKVEENIKPVGEVYIAGQTSAAAAPAAESTAEPAAARSGDVVYNASCVACHSAGVAGAPKLGDKAAWAPRIAQGMETLMQHVTNGLNAMPPKGTCMACTDDELKGALEYMVNQSR